MSKIKEFLKSKKIEISIFILVSILTFVFLVLAVEIFLRFDFARTKGFFLAKDAAAICSTFAKNKDLIYEFKPRLCGTNSQGYFDHEYSFEKPDDRFRLVIIGDSIDKGGTLENSFPKLLEAKNDSLEVVVLARQGYALNQKLALLKDEALDYNPDLIIFSYALNDPVDPVYYSDKTELTSFFVSKKSHALYLFSKGLFFIKEKLRSFGCPEEWHARLNCVYQDKIAGSVKEIGNFSRINNIPIVFLIHPVFEPGAYQRYSLTTVHQSLVSLAEQNGLMAWDILDLYKSYNADDLRRQIDESWYDPWHPNVFAHQLIADFLYNKLEDEKYLKPE